MKDIRAKINDIAKRRGIFWGAYEIYGGVAGLYDYGPIGAMLKKNILDLWVEEFVFKDGLMLVDAPALGPEMVYRASGHLDKFSDYMVQCKSCGHAFRVDELLKDFVEVPDELTPQELEREIKRHGIRCPDCNGELGKVEEFHLMFSTRIGLDKIGFLRPETAQGIFVNFPTLYRINREKLPMGVAQIGRAYRNEISPRQGVLRQREFNMAEVELFIDPEAPFPENILDDIAIPLLTREGENIKISALEAYKSGLMVGYIAYYIARIFEFFKKLGIPEDRIRFRQHHRGELAHYSSDTWDCEILISRGWTEVTGISYRTSYDLERHMLHSGADMRAFRRFDEEREIEVTRIVPRMEILGPMFKGTAMKIARAMEEIEHYSGGELKVEVDGKTYTVPEEAFEVRKENKKVSGERFIPHVIEPSFGIDRIIYAILELTYYERPDSGYKVLRFPTKIAPMKVGVFPLMAKDGLDERARELLKTLRNSGIHAYYDESGSIGRRYARADEIGVPFCITVDYQSIEDETVTIRERDSTEQRRVPMKELPRLIRAMERDEVKFDELGTPVQ
ncbi:MAG: glycine--tRNA ligase [Euryarchaeota archaeon]|nr:glycine--tRNA ligase [Euryarchaeota archaeon]